MRSVGHPLATVVQLGAPRKRIPEKEEGLPIFPAQVAVGLTKSGPCDSLVRHRFGSAIAVCSLASPISGGASLAPATISKSTRSDFAIAGDSTEESTAAGETKRILHKVPNRFDHE
jgi:hypothetical protein